MHTTSFRKASSPGSSRWCPAVLVVLAVLAGAFAGMRPVMAGPPTSDLPDVKMPPVAKDHPRLVFRPEGRGGWTFERVRHLYETGAEPPPPASRPATQPASQPATQAAAASTRPGPQGATTGTQPAGAVAGATQPVGGGAAALAAGTQPATSQATASQPGRGRRGGRGGEESPPTVPPTYEQATSLRAILKPWLERPVDKDPSPAASALRYRLTGNEAAAERAISQLLDRPMEQIGSEYYSNGWEFALAYDWLYDHPSITPEKRGKIEGYLVANAKRALELLNDEGWEAVPVDVARPDEDREPGDGGSAVAGHGARGR